MTVAELIEKLEDMPPDATVVVYEISDYDLVDQVEKVDLTKGPVGGLVEHGRYESHEGDPKTYVYVGSYG